MFLQSNLVCASVSVSATTGQPGYCTGKVQGVRTEGVIRRDAGNDTLYITRYVKSFLTYEISVFLTFDQFNQVPELKFRFRHFVVRYYVTSIWYNYFINFRLFTSYSLYISSYYFVEEALIQTVE